MTTASSSKARTSPPPAKNLKADLLPPVISRCDATLGDHPTPLTRSNFFLTDIMSLGAQIWEQVAMIHSNKYRMNDRDGPKLKKKFQDLYKK